MSAAGSGLADLQRRQAIIADIEDREQPGRRVPGAPEFRSPGGREHAGMADQHGSDELPVDLPMASDVPMARESVSTPAMSPVNSVADGAYDRPLTQGSAALDIAPDAAPQPVVEARTSPEGAVRGLDSTVTKSLVLRLIAGVRGL